jgi:hypothetical protein
LGTPLGRMEYHSNHPNNEREARLEPEYVDVVWCSDYIVSIDGIDVRVGMEIQ